jgi:hypothetical protein
MKVTLFMPRPAEAAVEHDTKQGLVNIVPIFLRKHDNQDLAFIEVAGAKGMVQKYILHVSGRNGRVSIRTVRPVAPEFDSTEAS